ncbi:uncharacterized protein V1518DRAFT_413351 [Limtongia smithiae]|uniref:uncharacterized protein n=1 Tax=Limtongia smithiae TaxID=1125753 RepID=UPI0034CF0B7C
MRIFAGSRLLSSSAPPQSSSASSSAISAAAMSAAKSLAAAVSPALPFPVSTDIASIDGPEYLAPQTLVELTAYALSDAVFAYSPESFSLDDPLARWAEARQANGFGVVPLLSQLETRTGSGALPLGYILSTKLQRVFAGSPRSIIASSGSLPALTPVLNEIGYLLSSLPAPIALSVSAVDYSAITGAYVSDFVTALDTARDAGLALVSSMRVGELQHMALYSALLASALPTIHVYDGVRLARECQRVVDVLGVRRLHDIFVRLATAAASDKTLLRVDNVAKAQRLLSAVNSELGTSYRMFEYTGHDQPDTVLVLLGAADAAIAADVAHELADLGEKVGVLAIRVAAPFGDSQFLNALPRSTKQIFIFGQVRHEVQVKDVAVHSSLYSDIFAAVVMSPDFPAGARPKLIDLKYTREQQFSPRSFMWVFEQIIRGVASISLTIPDVVLANEFSTVASFDLLQNQDVHQAIFWSLDDSVAVNAPARIAQLLSLDSTRNTTFYASYDNQTLAGLVQSELRSSKRTIDTAFSVTNADVVVIGDERVLSAYNAVKVLKFGGSLLITTGAKFEDFAEKLPFQVKELLVSREINVYTFNIADAAKDDKLKYSLFFQLAFLRIAYPTSSAEDYIGRLAVLNSNTSEITASTVTELVELVQPLLVMATVPKTWELKDDKEIGVLPIVPVVDSFTPNMEKNPEEPVVQVDSWQTAAKHLAFKEAYDFKEELRPDLPVKNFVAKVKELKRLTPESYDRNIFHIEFDISGTGLKYEIGEALGIHGRNDAASVDKFIAWYGLDPEKVVHVPSREDASQYEYRTIYSVLLENLDMFGKTPKKFYEALAEYATDEKQMAQLLKLSSAEGAEEFKRRSDEDTLTYADVLHEFDSAHPPFEDLVAIVNPLKRREYSIASSQKVHPNEVHLLIVVVDWVDSKGRKRYGQCSRYISQLKVGEELVVSVKPSVMKLPALTTQPIIMSGLGTGLAPFKAFVEEKAFQLSQGKEIGEIFLYLGSRHQKEEYLYGEFWEAHKAAGIITHIGAAFSRDQPEKIYIQDRMRETINELVPAFVEHQGVFYLCGPTWPVPDVTAVLEDVVKKDAEDRGVKVDAAKEVEELKEKSRYILEVY